MQNSHPQSPETWASDTLGHVVMGRNYLIYKGLSVVITKMMAALGMVLLRHRFGVNFITWSTLFWANLILGTAYLASGFSLPFMIWGILVMVASVYHIIESRSNLRRGKSARHSFEWGESWLAPLFAKLIMLLKLEKSFLFRNMTDFGFKKWTEPFLLFCLGVIAIMLGNLAFGLMVMMTSVCLFRLAVTVERDHFNRQQRVIDAQVGSEIMSNASQEMPASQPNIERIARPERRGNR